MSFLASRWPCGLPRRGNAVRRTNRGRRRGSVRLASRATSYWNVERGIRPGDVGLSHVTWPDQSRQRTIGLSRRRAWFILKLDAKSSRPWMRAVGPFEIACGNRAAFRKRSSNRLQREQIFRPVRIVYSIHASADQITDLVKDIRQRAECIAESVDESDPAASSSNHRQQYRAGTGRRPSEAENGRRRQSRFFLPMDCQPALFEESAGDGSGQPNGRAWRRAWASVLLTYGLRCMAAETRRKSWTPP